MLETFAKLKLPSQSTASIEAAAMSHINAQQAELNNAQQVVTILRGSLGQVEQIAQNEYSQNLLIKDQAVAELGHEVFAVAARGVLV